MSSTGLLHERVEHFARLIEKEVFAPVTIFATSLSPAEALVKYLKENKQLRFAEIARLLNRDQRGTWCNYNRACKKHPAPFELPSSSLHIPASLFRNRSLSILEHVVDHLRNKNIPVRDIAVIINKSPSTIAAVHHRVRRKHNA